MPPHQAITEALRRSGYSPQEAAMAADVALEALRSAGYRVG